MNAGLFSTAILSAAETFLNGLLTLDPPTPARLAKLSGKTLRVQCQLPAMNLNLLVSGGRILLLGGDGGSADATVSGKAHALLKLLVNKESAGWREDGIVISGDTGFLDDLQQILFGLDVDWEYQLSRFIGDIPTQAISDSVTGTKNFVRKSADSLRDDMDAWLHEEKRLFPDRTELEGFYRAVDNLRLRVDRLEARTLRLQSSGFTRT